MILPDDLLRTGIMIPQCGMKESNMTTEKLAPQKNGLPFLFLFILMILACITSFFYGIVNFDYVYYSEIFILVPIPSLIITIFLMAGLFTVEPNEARVLILFGNYIGTEKGTGFRWANPFITKKKISLRARNFDGEKLKVNDKKGNPIEISAVIVWRVDNTAQATFDIDSYDNYVRVQSESALRHLATSYPYDDTEGEKLSLRSSIEEVTEALLGEIQERVKLAGVIVDEARINHLAYAPEIAQAMLQVQQAEAIIAARVKIVDGAVGMVEMALNKLKTDGILDLDEERKAQMVSNLLVVLCSDKATQPIINSGSLY